MRRVSAIWYLCHLRSGLKRWHGRKTCLRANVEPRRVCSSSLRRREGFVTTIRPDFALYPWYCLFVSEMFSPRAIAFHLFPRNGLCCYYDNCNAILCHTVWQLSLASTHGDMHVFLNDRPVGGVEIGALCIVVQFLISQYCNYEISRPTVQYTT